MPVPAAYGQHNYPWNDVSPYASVSQNGSQGFGGAPAVDPVYGQNSHDVASSWNDVSPYASVSQNGSQDSGGVSTVDPAYGQSNYDVASSRNNVSPYTQNCFQGFPGAPTVDPAYGQSNYDVASSWNGVTSFHGGPPLRYPRAANEMHGYNAMLNHHAYPVGATHASANVNNNANSLASSSVVPTLAKSALPMDPNLTNTEDGAKDARPTCSTCGKTFGRGSDLQRHEQKHLPNKPFRCVVAGCGYKGSYRKDKLDQHVRIRHQSAHSAQH